MASIRVTAENVAAVRKALEAAKKRLDDLSPVAKRATVYLLGLVQRNFSSKSPAAKKWKPLAPITLFIRKHRASAPNNKAVPLNDRGLLRNSNFPFVRQGGAEFGVANNVSYASDHQFGGTSKADTVVIRNFRKKLPGGGQSRVIKPTYTIKLKGGADIPPRPFFPFKDEYLPGLMKIFRRHRDDAIGGSLA